MLSTSLGVPAEGDARAPTPYRKPFLPIQSPSWVGKSRHFFPACRRNRCDLRSHRHSMRYRWRRDMNSAPTTSRQSMLFRDRADAGRRLAAALKQYAGEDVVVYALPRGGALVAAPVAIALKAPLDLILVRKLGVPFQPELAMGAVADGNPPNVVRNEDVIEMAGVSDAEFEAARLRQLAEIERRRAVYLGDRSRPEAKGRVAIVVDDGIATGATTRAALRAIRARQPKTVVLATPVASPRALEFAEGGGRRNCLSQQGAGFRRNRRILCRFPPARRQGGDRGSRLGQ